MQQEFNIVPVAKPRMTRSDKWKRRDCVLRYRQFCDEVKLNRISLRSGYHIVFVLPMPACWSQTKRQQMNGRPHQQKPDKDNLEKAILDACFTDDSHIWDGRVTKLWGETGKIIITYDDYEEISEMMNMHSLRLCLVNGRLELADANFPATSGGKQGRSSSRIEEKLFLQYVEDNEKLPFPEEPEEDEEISEEDEYAELTALFREGRVSSSWSPKKG